MRVLMISGNRTALTPGGGIYERLVLQANETDGLVALMPGPRKYQRLGDHGEAYVFPGSKADAARLMLRFIRRARQSGEQFDIVTAQDPFFLGFVGWRAARVFGAKLELQIHTDIFSPALRVSFLKKRIAAFLLPRADCIRVVSDEIRQAVLARWPQARVSVLPIFSDVEAFRVAAPANLKAVYPQFSKYVLIAARLEAEKKIDTLLRYAAQILAAVPEAGLLVAGGGSQRGALEKLASRLGIAERTVFLGFRTDMPALYKAADLVLAATADFEGYGAGVVEALAAGAPVLSLDRGIARRAGAAIAEPDTYAETGARLLREGGRGELKLDLPSAPEWAKRWRQSLGNCL